MSLIDTILVRRHVSLPSAPALEECRQRIGADTQYSGFQPVDLNRANPIIIKWAGDDEVRAYKPMTRRLRPAMSPRAELRARFVPQADGTDAEITTGFLPFQVVNYVGLWAFLLFFVIAAAVSGAQANPRNDIGLAFGVLLIPVIYLMNRGTIARQSADILMSFENLLETPAFAAPTV